MIRDICIVRSFVFFKQKTANYMRISDWSSDVCSSDLRAIGGYTLAIKWAPQFCHDRAKQASAKFQCGSGNRFGFTLHGLWPDGKTKEWPQYCRPASLLPERVLSQHLCATPDLQLIQHEWAKHGDRKSTRLNSSH